MGRYKLLALAAAAVLGLGSGQARAQIESEIGGVYGREPDLSVLGRAHPGFDAIGIPAGGFIVFPSVNVALNYDDNVFATQGATKSDFFAVVNPQIDLQSRWSRNELDANLHLSNSTYFRYSSEDTTAYGAGAKGVLDLSDVQIKLAAGYDHLIDPRTDAASPADAKNPVEYDDAAVSLSLSRELGRIRLSGGLTYHDYDYDDAETTSGANISQKYRDDDLVSSFIRGDYALSPALALFTSIGHDMWAFDKSSSPDHVDRDTSTSQIDVGADFDLTRLVRGQVQVGYLYADYSQPGVKSGGGLALLGKVEWFPTPLVTVTLNGQRSVQASGVIGSPATTTTSAGAQADYELLRNLIITARFQRVSYDYEGIDRSDEDWSAGLSLLYSFSHWLALKFEYGYYDQSSDGSAPGPSFAENRVQAGLVFRY